MLSWNKKKRSINQLSQIKVISKQLKLYNMCLHTLKD